MNNDQTGFGVFDSERIVGFATLSHHIFGGTANYIELVCFQTSEEYRHQGIGRKLFTMICEEARQLGADKLYIDRDRKTFVTGIYKRIFRS
ncbi:MAG: GNAT family N-acetyltransferase [Lachnospiraceae bacterium]|nr:GNAT family N-acetyltransferase [Lachnospiraceae bacterium]